MRLSVISSTPAIFFPCHGARALRSPARNLLTAALYLAISLASFDPCAVMSIGPAGPGIWRYRTSRSLFVARIRPPRRSCTSADPAYLLIVRGVTPFSRAARERVSPRRIDPRAFRTRSRAASLRGRNALDRRLTGVVVCLRFF